MPDTDTKATIGEVMTLYGVDEAKARFILALRRGEIEGDIVILDEDGNEVRDDDTTT